MFANSIVTIFYTYIYRGVVKDESNIIKLLNGIVFSIIVYYGIYYGTNDRNLAFFAAVLVAFFFIVLFIFFRSRINVHNGPVFETVDVIEGKFKEENIFFEKKEEANNIMYRLSDKEHIELTYKNSRLNDDYCHSVVMNYKLKEHRYILDDIVEQLREKRKERSFRKRVLFNIVDVVITIIILFVFIYFVHS